MRRHNLSSLLALLLAIASFSGCLGGAGMWLPTTTEAEAGDAEGDTLTISGTLSLTGDDNTDASITSSLLLKATSPRYVVEIPAGTTVHVLGPDGKKVLDEDGKPLKALVADDGSFSLDLPKEVIADVNTVTLESNHGISIVVTDIDDTKNLPGLALNPYSTLSAAALAETLKEDGFSKAFDFSDVSGGVDYACFNRMMHNMSALSENDATKNLGSSLRAMMNIVRAAAISGSWQDEYPQKGGFSQMIKDVMAGEAEAEFIAEALDDAVEQFGGNRALLKENYDTLVIHFADMRGTLADNILTDLTEGADEEDAEEANSITYKDICSEDMGLDVVQTFLQFNPESFVQVFIDPDALGFQMEAMKKYMDTGTGRIPEGLAAIIAGTMEALPSDKFGDFSGVEGHMESLRKQTDGKGLDVRSVVEGYMAGCMSNPDCFKSPDSKEAKSHIATMMMVNASGVTTTVTDREHWEDFKKQIEKMVANTGNLKVDITACTSNPATCKVSMTNLMAGVDGQHFAMEGTGMAPTAMDYKAEDTQRGVPTGGGTTTTAIATATATATGTATATPPGTGTIAANNVQFTVTTNFIGNVDVVLSLDTNINNAKHKITKVGTGGPSVTGTIPNVAANTYFLWAETNTGGTIARAYFGSNNGTQPAAANFRVPADSGVPITLAGFANVGGGGLPNNNTLRANINLNAAALGLTNSQSYAFRLTSDADSNVANGTDHVFNSNFTYNSADPRILATGGVSPDFTGLIAGAKYIRVFIDKNADGVLNPGDPIGWVGTNSNVPPNAPSATIAASGITTVTLTINNLLP